MGKYLLRRILYGLLSIVAVTAIIMLLVYSGLDRTLVFANDSVFAHMTNNARDTYMYQKWEEFGYIDYVTYADYLLELRRNGTITEETRESAVIIGKTPEADSQTTKEYVDKFISLYESKGYTIVRKDAVMIGKKVAKGGNAILFAYKELPLLGRIGNYFKSIITIDNIHNAETVVGERGLTFTLHDPVYGGEKFAPAIIGNGTTHKYLLYTDSRFPYIHQNMVTICLGQSYTVNQGIDVFDTMTKTQGSYTTSTVIYPSGLVEESADDLHSAVYSKDSLGSSTIYMERFVDDYTKVNTVKAGNSRIGYSFIIGVIATIAAYLIGIPLGVLMSRKKDKFFDKLGTIYIVFIIAVPSLAYIFLFKAIGGKFGLPTTFNMETTSRLIYVLPIVSLALPQIGNLMKWVRRYMIDQMNSDYVKFARSGGLTEGEIFNKHILKNAAIPIVHGIPGAILGALIGAIITERVYVVPGTGNLLTSAINAYDNSVIVGVALFYAILSVTSIILGDILMSVVDPRISFSSKNR